ncbi:hypothetical protein [Streptomyces sp. NPDC002547]
MASSTYVITLRGENDFATEFRLNFDEDKVRSSETDEKIRAVQLAFRDLVLTVAPEKESFTSFVVHALDDTLI